MTEKNISLDGVHEQLVDINNGVREFSVVIHVTPPEDEMDNEYNIGIGTQSQIDNKKEISFSAIKGIYKKSFSHSQVNPAGDPDVFYLIMSSKIPVNNLKVIIDLVDNTPVDPAPSLPPPAQEVRQPAPIVQHKEQNKNVMYAKYALAAVILSIGAYFLYKFWQKSKDDTKALKSVDAPQSVAPQSVAPQSVAPQPVAPQPVPAPPASTRHGQPSLPTESVAPPQSFPSVNRPTFSFY